jgi:hypothetical protein
MRVRLALGENETVVLLGFLENVLGLRLWAAFGEDFSHRRPGCILLKN